MSISPERAMDKRKTIFIFAALFLAGIASFVAGRLLSSNQPDDMTATFLSGQGQSRVGNALDQAIGLGFARTPESRHHDQ
jgi:hypothetical protein